jgi:predicted transcriptional regulator
MTVEEIEKAVAKLAPEEFAQFCAWLEEFEMAQSTKDGFYHASEEELRGIERGLRASAEGRFATAEEVEATFAKFRTP